RGPAVAPRRGRRPRGGAGADAQWDAGGPPRGDRGGLRLIDDAPRTPLGTVTGWLWHATGPSRPGGESRMAASDHETVFTLEATPIKFGPGAADDAGWELRRQGVKRVMLVTDPGVAKLGHP